eukprot:26166_1
MSTGQAKSIRMMLLYFLCVATAIQFALIVNVQLYTANEITSARGNNKKQHLANEHVQKVETQNTTINRTTLNRNGFINKVNLSASEWLCLSHASDRQNCTLFPNITIVFNTRMGKGSKSEVWSVSESNRVVAMKYTINKHKWFICDRKAMIEYETMDNLYKYDDSLNVAQLIYTPQLHYYYQYIYPQNDTVAGCVYFMTQLNATDTLGDLRSTFYNLRSANQLATQYKIHRHFISDDPLQFIMNCYSDVVSVLNAVNAIGKYYNDLHPRQVLIEDRTRRCYLIDFNVVRDLSRMNSMRRLRCVWLRCPARTYYSAWISRNNGTKNQNILFQIEYEVFTMMLHLFVDVCGNMERIHGNATIARMLLSINAHYVPNDYKTWVMSTRHNKKQFKKAYCHRQTIVVFLRNIESFNKLECVKASNMSLRRAFLAVLDIYGDDVLYLDRYLAKNSGNDRCA